MRNSIRTNICLIILSCSCLFCVSQEVVLKGKIIAKNELGGIHVMNTSINQFSVSDDNGAFFIRARLNDSIYFSAIQYEPKTIVVDSYMLATQMLLVELTERVNILDEVIIGKILTGDLTSDLENSDAKAELNFYDLGIPGYIGKQKTQNERRLFEADAGKFVYYYGLAMTINVNKILNRLSGRTKELKARVRTESQNLCMERVRTFFSESLFADTEVPEDIEIAFFYYVSDDQNFLNLCDNHNDMEMYEFLMSKLVVFNSENLEIED